MKFVTYNEHSHTYTEHCHHLYQRLTHCFLIVIPIPGGIMVINAGLRWNGRSEGKQHAPHFAEPDLSISGVKIPETNLPKDVR